MTRTAAQHLLWLACIGVCAAFTSLAWADAGRDQLRVIVQQQCLPHWLQARDPAPCVSVRTLDEGDAPDGFAVLADRKGGAHFLLIPTRTITGIESLEVRGVRALNFFAAAWDERYVLTGAVGHAVPRAAVAMAVNQHRARSQDQLHIHLSCLRAQVRDALQSQADHISHEWSSVSIDGASYQALRVMGSELGSANPFALLAARLPDARRVMDEYTVLVAGMQFEQRPGFVVLAGRAVPGAELLLDPGCALAAEDAAPVTRPDGFVPRLEAQLLLQTLNADLLSHDSATATLERWCAEHRLASPARIVAERVPGTDKAPSEEQRRELAVTAGEPVRYRRVRLRCGSLVLSEAENWYVPARLTADMNHALDTSDVPFGRVVQPLHFRRHTLSVKLLAQLLPDGWEMSANVPAEPAGSLPLPAQVLEHRAVLTLPEGTPISEVVETYTSNVLAFAMPERQCRCVH